VGLIRSDDGEMAEAEVRHGARDGPDVERVARGDEDHVDRHGVGGRARVVFERGGQGHIVEGWSAWNAVERSEERV